MVSLSKEFGIGKTQAYGILKDKNLLMKEFKRPSYERKLERLRYPTIDDAVFKWFCNRRELKLPISGPLIREQALLIAAALMIEYFKASSGWLDIFKKRHFIKSKIINCESGTVNREVASEWIENLGDTTHGYSNQIFLIWMKLAFFIVDFHIRLFVWLKISVMIATFQLTD